MTFSAISNVPRDEKGWTSLLIWPMARFLRTFSYAPILSFFLKPGGGKRRYHQRWWVSSPACPRQIFFFGGGGWTQDGRGLKCPIPLEFPGVAAFTSPADCVPSLALHLHLSLHDRLAYFGLPLYLMFRERPCSEPLIKLNLLLPTGPRCESIPWCNMSPQRQLWQWWPHRLCPLPLIKRHSRWVCCRLQTHTEREGESISVGTTCKVKLLQAESRRSRHLSTEMSTH